MATRTTIVFFFSAIILVAPISATYWDSENYPNPKRDVHLCGRKGKQSSICDPDSVLTYAGANRIEGIIEDVWLGVAPYIKRECGKSGPQGFQVAIALMQHMKVPSSMAPATVAQQMAKDLHAKWAVGSSDCDNGVVLLLSVKDRQVYISTGAGSMRYLSNNSLVDIISNMKPKLRERDFDGALEQAVVDIGLGLAGRPPAKHTWEIVPIVFFAFVFFLMGRSWWKAKRQRKRYLECCNALQKIKLEQDDKLRRKEWSYPRSCPICLEDFHPSRNMQPEAETSESESLNPTRPLLPGQSDNQSPEQEATRETHLRDSSGSKPSASTPNDTRNAVTLRCGHTFCEQCLQSWLEQQLGQTCPICRKPVKPTGEERDEPDSQPGTSDNRSDQPRSSEIGVRYPGGVDLTQELIFRLLSLQQRYPTFVSDEDLRILSSDASTTGTLNWESIRNFQINNPELRVHRENMGALGNSSSFGGGTGGGGGGAGGTW